MLSDSRTAMHGLWIKTDVLEAARTAAYAFTDPATAEEGPAALAAKMGVPAGTLYNKLNPHESSHHKLTVQDLVQIVGITGDLAILKALCRTFGCICFPVPNLANVSDEALLELVNKIGIEGGDFFKAINGALSRKNCAAKDIAVIHKEGMEYIGAIAEAMERTKGLLRS